MISQRQSEMDILAAEYALGSLENEERRAAQDLLKHDADFARLVLDWQYRLGALADTIAPVEPPDDLWLKIESRLLPESAPASVARATARPAQKVGTSLLHSLAFWRWTSFGAMAAAAASLAFAVYVGGATSRLEVRSQRYIAVLNAGENRPALVVTIDQGTHQMTIRPVRAEQPAGKSLQLWLVAGDTPRPLGLLNADARTSLSLQPTLDAGIATGVLAVSLEPEGGSPTGLPTGPVVYQGELLPLDL